MEYYNLGTKKKENWQWYCRHCKFMVRSINTMISGECDNKESRRYKQMVMQDTPVCEKFIRNK